MSQYSDANIKFCGSHAGVSIGEDGPSQMGLEDIAMFRTILGSVVLYPSDAVSTERLVEEAARHYGLDRIYRTTRMATPILYSDRDEFPDRRIKGAEKKRPDEMTVVAAGITLFEALQAYEELKDGRHISCGSSIFTASSRSDSGHPERGRPRDGPSSPWKTIMPKEVWERRSGAPWPESDGRSFPGRQENAAGAAGRRNFWPMRKFPKRRSSEK